MDCKQFVDVHILTRWCIRGLVSGEISGRGKKYGNCAATKIIKKLNQTLPRPVPGNTSTRRRRTTTFVATDVISQRVAVLVSQSVCAGRGPSLSSDRASLLNWSRFLQGSLFGPLRGGGGKKGGLPSSLKNKNVVNLIFC